MPPVDPGGRPPGGSRPPLRAELRVRADEPGAAARLACALAGWLAQRDRERVVVVCIGTDRSTGDALGPLVGTLLARAGVLPEPAVTLLGTLDEPVHAGNLDRALEEVAAAAGRATVIAVDACLGRSENVGSVSAGRGPLQPGAGVNKSLPAVGDLFVTGTVNVGGFMEYFVLQNTRLSLVVRMAEVIASGIAGGVSAFLAAREAAACQAGPRPAGTGGPGHEGGDGPSTGSWPDPRPASKHSRSCGPVPIGLMLAPGSTAGEALSGVAPGGRQPGGGPWEGASRPWYRGRGG